MGMHPFWDDRVTVVFGPLRLSFPAGVRTIDRSTGRLFWSYTTANGTMPGPVLVTIARAVRMRDGRELISRRVVPRP